MCRYYGGISFGYGQGPHADSRLLQSKISRHLGLFANHTRERIGNLLHQIGFKV